MRVTFTSSFRNATADMERAQSAMAEKQRQVSSGKRILAPSDDPTGTSTSILEHTALGTIDQYVRTADSATARLTVVDTVLTEITKKLDQARSTLTTAQGSNLTAGQRTALVDEMRSLRDSVFSSMTTQFRGAYLFGGTLTSAPPYTQAANGVVSAYLGDTSTASVDVDRTRSVQVTFVGDSIMRGAALNDLFTTFEVTIAAMAASNSLAMEAGAAELTAAAARVGQAQSRVGTDLASLDDRRVVHSTSRRAAQSRLESTENVDMVAAVTGLTQAEAAYEGALASTATIGRLSLLDFLR